MNPAPPPRRCALLLLPGYSLLAAAGVIEALQRVNALLPEGPRYQSVSLGLGTNAAGPLPAQPLRGDEPDWFAVFVLAGEGAETTPALQAWLRAQAARGAILAGIDGGSACLAEAGLLDGRRACVDWGLLDALRAEQPQVIWCPQVWEIDAEPAPALLSCAGAAASLDLMCAWLARAHGERLGQQLARALGLERMRGREERQRAPEGLGAAASPKLVEALALMEANLAEPLPTEEVARLVGVSRRQLERLFKQHLDALPSRHYLELRLQRARRLLQQSGQSVLQIGLSCGFSSGPHFSNAYKAAFGRTPREERSPRAAAPWRAGGESPQ